MAKAVKNLTKNILPAVTTLKTDEGTYTEAGEETCKEIMTKHFPTHTHYREGVYTTNKIKTQGAAAYQLGNTSSRTITEVKQR